VSKENIFLIKSGRKGLSERAERRRVKLSIYHLVENLHHR